MPASVEGIVKVPAFNKRKLRASDKWCETRQAVRDSVKR